jgi:ribosomal protein S18 acetylase RimI-like enzyme
MAEVEIRPVVSTDIPTLLQFDHSCETTYVWQLESSSPGDRYDLHLSRIRLPRTLKLNYPRPYDSLKFNWKDHLLFLVARCEGNVVGYLVLDEKNEYDSAVLKDLVVSTPLRRQGIGTALVLAAQDWLKRNGISRMVIEVPAKNHAMIQLARKLQFVFSGFADNYYANRDIAFFFVNMMR